MKMENLCRSDVEAPFGVAQRVTTQYFLEHILPTLPPKLSVKDLLINLRRSGKKSWRPITQQGCWRGFPDDLEGDPRDKRTTFAHFAAIVKAISAAAATRGYAATMKYTQHLTEEGSALDGASLPDGYITPLGTEEGTWEEITAVGWYSKSYGSANTYAVSLVSSCLALG